MTSHLPAIAETKRSDTLPPGETVSDSIAEPEPILDPSAEPEPVLDPPAERIVDGLVALSRIFVALITRSLNEMDADVTLSQFRTLVVLATRGPQRTGSLAAELRVLPSTVTRACDRLITKGLVRRQQGGLDRRVAWLVLTEAGKKLVAETMRRRRTEIARLVQRSSIESPETVSLALDTLVQVAGEDPDHVWWDKWANSTELPQR